MAFVQRQIEVSFTSSSGTTTVDGLRTSCKVGKWGGAAMGTMELAIFGLSLSTMNQLSTVGTQYNFIGANSVSVSAGDADSGLSLVFAGTILKAWVDANAMPEVAFRVSALAGGAQAAQPAQPTSVQGAGDVGQMFGQLAQGMNLQFENNSVNVKLANPYLWGDLRTQAKELAKAAGVEWIIDNNTLAIWNPGSSRQTNGEIMISPLTGMVSYPSFDSAALLVTTLFNPAILPGVNIQVQSDLTPACGQWNVVSLDIDLESMTPHGAWFQYITAAQQQGGASPQEEVQ